MNEPIEIRYLDESNAGPPVLAVRGEIDAEGSREIRSRVLELSDQGHECVVLDLNQVDLLASTGVGTLLLLTETLRNKGQRFVLRDVSDTVRQVIGLLNLNAFLDIEDTTPSAP